MDLEETARAILMERAITWMKRAEAAEARAAELQRHLESLTPGGSEYHNDQHRCYEWIAERLRLPVRQQKRISELQAEVERLRARVAELERENEQLVTLGELIKEKADEYKSEVERLTRELRFFKGLAPVHEVDEFYKD